MGTNLRMDQWITNKGSKMGFNTDGLVFKHGAFSEITSLFLPKTIKFITICENTFYFVTYDDLYSIKYVDNWLDSCKQINTTNQEAAQYGFYSGDYWNIKVPMPILGIQATKRGLFALITDEGYDGNLYIHKWDLNGGHILAEPFVYSIDELKRKQDDDIRFITSDNKRSSELLLYGINNNSVYTGKLSKGQRKVFLEKAEKLSVFCNNQSIAFTLKQSVDEHSTHIDYWGFFWDVEKNKPLFFEYRHSISQKEDSKLYYKELSCDCFDINSIMFKNVTSIYKATIKVVAGHKTKDISSDFLLLATKDPNVIFLMQDSGKGFHMSPLIYEKSAHIKNGLDEIAFGELKSYVDTICVANERFLLYGNRDDDAWGIYTCPYYTQKDSEKITLISDSLTNS